ncbi:DoxX family protein [Variovorax sp. J2P1-59]|uniref:DoxX family protein n=1 Tax=Variovorax flavidus TaxID=3053501 RepID=UPI0025782427|nr:DoxX family protein [Variovorax sp. J2P1-59]MDM0075844.1 DoxX family protein [Variovorax sp. J2P1-59]
MATATTAPQAHPSIDDPRFTLEGSIARHQDTVLLLARLALAYIFIESAINHAMNLAGFAATFKNFQLPEALGIPAAALGVVVELLGGIAVALGYRVRETAILMIVFLFVTIFIGHRFWEFEGAARRLHVIQIKKNVAIIGGFLAVLVCGGGRFALSAWFAQRTTGQAGRAA